jgi:hypothetical protein
MSQNPENKAKFNPWWRTYCSDGKTACGKDEWFCDSPVEIINERERSDCCVLSDD